MSYHPKRLQLLRDKSKYINGLLVVRKKYVELYLRPKELEAFIKKFGWTEEYAMVKCINCNNTHACPSHVVRKWAQFMQLHTILSQPTGSKI